MRQPLPNAYAMLPTADSVAQLPVVGPAHLPLHHTCQIRPPYPVTPSGGHHATPAPGQVCPVLSSPRTWPSAPLARTQSLPSGYHGQSLQTHPLDCRRRGDHGLARYPVFCSSCFVVPLSQWRSEMLLPFPLFLSPSVYPPADLPAVARPHLWDCLLASRPGIQMPPDVHVIHKNSFRSLELRVISVARSFGTGRETYWTATKP
jgi:hypothetical protein